MGPPLVELYLCFTNKYGLQSEQLESILQHIADKAELRCNLTPAQFIVQDSSDVSSYEQPKSSGGDYS